MIASASDPKGGVAPVSRRVMNLAHFVRQAARRHGQEIGLAWATRPGPGPRIDRRVDAMATALAAKGVAKGDRVLVQSKNGNQMFESMFACFRLGAVWVPTNFRQTPGEVAYLGQASGASAMICHGDFPEHAAAARAATDIRFVVSIGAFGLRRGLRGAGRATFGQEAAGHSRPSMTTRAGSSSPRAPRAGPRRRSSRMGRWRSSSPTISAT